MSASFTPIVLGHVAGFERPVSTLANKQLQCFESIVETDYEHSFNERIFLCVSQFFFPTCVQQAFPHLPQKPIDLSFNVYHFRLSAATKSVNPLAQKINCQIIDFLVKKTLPVLMTEEELNRLYCGLRDAFLPTLGFKATPLSKNFSAEESAVLGIPASELQLLQQLGPNLSPQALDCTRFALLKVKESRVCELLFNQDPQLDMQKVFFDWGYRTVSALQPNDLILYVNRGKLMHTAVYIKEGMAESKFGYAIAHSYVHPLEVVWSAYGTHMVFLRKVHQSSKPTFTDMLMKCGAFHFGYPPGWSPDDKKK
jgi:hypothetical protein